MPAATPAPPREFATPDGGRWIVRPLERGAPSPYLSAKVSRPLVEFERLDAPAPRRYASLRADLGSMDDTALAALWSRARSS